MLKISGYDEENKIRFTKEVEGAINIDSKSDVDITREFYNVLVEYNLSLLLYGVSRVVFQNEHNEELTFNVYRGFMFKDYKFTNYKIEV